MPNSVIGDRVRDYDFEKSLRGTTMPYTAAQNRLFRAAAHNTAIAKAHGLSKRKAAMMAAEGVKRVRRQGS